MVKAKLIIEGKEINVLWFTFGFNQNADHNGRPNQNPVFINLNVIIESQRDVNLADWSFAPDQTRQLELHISPVILGEKTRKIYLYDSHLINWKNHFSATSSYPMAETLEVSAAGIETSFSDAIYSASWRKTFKSNNVIPKKRKNTEEEVIDCYLTDLENNESPHLEIGDEVYLVVKTKNMIGQSKDIDVSNFDLTFEYKNKILENNMVEAFSISSNIHKVKLKIINPQGNIIALED